MSIGRIVLATIIVVLALGIPGAALGQTNPTVIKGSVTASNFRPLSSSGRLIAYLYETPQGRGRRQVAASPSTNIGGKALPFAYEIRTSAALNRNSVYDVEIVLAEGAGIRYRGTARISNLNANPITVDVSVSPSSGSLPNTSSGILLLLWAILAAALAGGAMVLRRVALRRLAQQ